VSVEVKIPAVGESISSGVVSVWHKKSGDFVNSGDALFTLETDKVSTEISAETSGVLDTLVPEGQEVKVGEVVATIDDSKKAPEAKPSEKKTVGDAVSVPGKPTASPTKEKSTDGETLSPAVRRIVDEENLDPAKISGTGKGELFIRYVLGHEIASRMAYLGESLETAADHLIGHDLKPHQIGAGLVAVDSEGNISAPFNTDGMYRGWVTVEGECFVATHHQVFSM